MSFPIERHRLVGVKWLDIKACNWLEWGEQNDNFIDENSLK